MSGNCILFLSEDFGKGHQRAAEAMAKGVAYLDKDAQTKVINVGSQYMPKLFKFLNKTYLNSIKYSPALYKKLYEKPCDSSMWSIFNTSLGLIYISTLKQIIRDFRPRLIVCTHPFPAIALGKLKKTGLNIPLAVAVTDYGYNQSWFVNEADIIFTATEEQKRLASFLGIATKKTYHLGIPIDPEFKFTSDQLDKQSAKKKLGLDPALPTILIMSGGLGLTLTNQELESLYYRRSNKQLIIITGNNQVLKKELEEQTAHNPDVTILGWIDNVHEYLRATDLLISKPGGVTTAEALSMGVPLLMINPLPGQEIENMQYIIRNKAGVYYDKNSKYQLIDMVDTLLADNQLQATMVKNTQKIGIADSALIGGMVLDDLLKAKKTLGRNYYGLSR